MYRARGLVVALAVLPGLLASCSDRASGASTEYCDIASSATDGRINFSDEAQFARLVGHPGLPARYRAAMTAAVETARERTAGRNAWSNEDMVGTVNAMCHLSLTPVTMMP